MLLLAAKGARFSRNDWTLAGVQDIIHSVFNLIVDIHVMVNWQLSKKGNQ